MNIFNSGNPVVLMAMACVFVLSACASTDTDPTRVEQDFGRSVQQMVDGQIYDPEAARNPRKSPPKGIDGVQAEAAMEAYREHVGDPGEVTESLRMEISE